MNAPRSLVLYALLVPTRPAKPPESAYRDLNLGNQQVAQYERSKIEYARNLRRFKKIKLSDTLASAAEDEDMLSLLLDAVNRKVALRASPIAGTMTLLTDEETPAHSSFRKVTALTGNTVRGSWVTVCQPIEFALEEGKEIPLELIGIQAFDQSGKSIPPAMDAEKVPQDYLIDSERDSECITRLYRGVETIVIQGDSLGEAQTVYLEGDRWDLTFEVQMAIVGATLFLTIRAYGDYEDLTNWVELAKYDGLAKACKKADLGRLSSYLDELTPKNKAYISRASHSDEELNKQRVEGPLMFTMLELNKVLLAFRVMKPAEFSPLVINRLAAEGFLQLHQLEHQSFEGHISQDVE